MVINFNKKDVARFGQHVANWIAQGMILKNENGVYPVSEQDVENWLTGLKAEAQDVKALSDAELLIISMPVESQKRKNWLIQYGKGLEAEELRKRQSFCLSEIEGKMAVSIGDESGNGKGSCRVFSCNKDDGGRVFFYVPLWVLAEWKAIETYEIPAIDLAEWIKL